MVWNHKPSKKHGKTKCWVHKTFTYQVHFLDPHGERINLKEMFWFVGILLFVFSFGCSEDRSDVVVDTEIVPGIDRLESGDLTPNSFVGEEDLTGNASDKVQLSYQQLLQLMKLKNPKMNPWSSTTESIQGEDGIRSTFYEDGTLKEEVTYVNGRKNGLVRRWFGNGQLKCRGQMMNNRWNGVYEEWFENGESKTIGVYLDGRQDGEWKFFDKSGEKMPSLFFVEGKEVAQKLLTVYFQNSTPFRFNSVEEGSP